MINKPFEQIEKNDIDALVSNKVSEGRTMDYKQELPSRSDKNKRDFLADVSSFANASGGDLLYGIREKRDKDRQPTGLPEAADGLAEMNADTEIRRLESMIRDGVDPRIPGVQMRPIQGFPRGPVLILRVPKSWASPHMVTLKSRPRFYSRNSAGKHPLDVGEIRAAFALSEALPQKIRAFRVGRLEKIDDGETPEPLVPGARVVLHLLPIGSLDPGARVEVIPFPHQQVLLRPIRDSGFFQRYNFDGYLAYDRPEHDPTCRSYVQLFRDGAVEAVAANLLRERDDEKLIPSITYEEALVSSLEQYLSFERYLGIEPPIFVMLSLLAVRGYEMEVDQGVFRIPMDAGYPIDRDDLLCPETIVESYESKAADILRPTFDAVWQAAGWGRSMNYDKSGKWIRDKA